MKIDLIQTYSSVIFILPTQKQISQHTFDKNIFFRKLEILYEELNNYAIGIFQNLFYFVS